MPDGSFREIDREYTKVKKGGQDMPKVGIVNGQ